MHQSLVQQGNKQLTSNANPNPKRFGGVDRFWNRIAKRYSKKSVADEAAYQRKLATTREYLSSHSTVLEIGCGTGSTALNHSAYAGQIIATDFSSAMIEIAEQKKLESEFENVHFECKSATNALSDNQELDVILALSLLHLLTDWQSIIHQCYQSLKPGGVLIQSTACLKDGPSWLKLISPLASRFNLLPQLSFFDESELLETLQLAGFSVEHRWQPNPRTGVFIVARKP